MLSIIAGLARSRNLRVAVLCGFAAVLAVACDKVPLLAPQESTITLSSASTVVQANGTTQIHAIVIEPSGTPVHDGTTVLFTTNLGTLLPVEARTQNGVATVQFLGNGQSGKATIKALSGGSASEALELSVGAGASGRVSVTANLHRCPPPEERRRSPRLLSTYRGIPFRSACEFSDDCRHVQLRRCKQRCIGNRAHDVDDESGCERDGHSRRHDFCAVAITVAVRPTVTITVPAARHLRRGVTTLSLTVTPPATGGSPIQE